MQWKSHLLEVRLDLLDQYLLPFKNSNHASDDLISSLAFCWDEHDENLSGEIFPKHLSNNLPMSACGVRASVIKDKLKEINLPPVEHKAAAVQSFLW